MNEFFERIYTLVHAGKIRISEHGYDELTEDKLTAKEAIAGVSDSIVVEEYPPLAKRACYFTFTEGSKWKTYSLCMGNSKRLYNTCCFSNRV